MILIFFCKICHIFVANLATVYKVPAMWAKMRGKKIVHNWITSKIKINFLNKKQQFLHSLWYIKKNPLIFCLKLHSYSGFSQFCKIIKYIWKKILRILGHYEVMGYQNASKCIYDPLKADDKILLFKKGASIFYVDKILDFFDPPSPLCR